MSTKTVHDEPQFEPLLSDLQVGKLLGLHSKTVQKMARSGQIPALRIGRYWRYRASVIDRWIELQSCRQSACVETERRL